MRIAVLGVGLIGGSIGLAARRRLGAEVAGFDPRPANLERALEVGALDRAAPSLADAVAGAEAVFCAAPVTALPALVAEAIAASGEGVVVTDVGSTKRALLDAVEGLDGAERFIGGHPLAGAETAGVEGSREDLFEGARWYLTPSPRSEGVLFERLRRLIADIGARPQAVEAAIHDREMATVSHLPHVLANALVAVAADSLGDGTDRRAEVGRSFRDAVRVAGANPGIWADIYGTNADAVAEEIDAVIERLQQAAALIRGRDVDELARWQASIGEERRRLLAEHVGTGELTELLVVVENRPGTIAEIALSLGQAGVNIADMSLFPAADRRTGAVSLWIDGAEAAGRAAELVAELGHQVTTVPASES